MNSSSLINVAPQTSLMFRTTIYRFWIDEDKLPYFTFNYSIVERDREKVKIEVSVDAYLLSNLVYAGVFFGIDQMTHKQKVA
jgi:hypothetical protein